MYLGDTIFMSKTYIYYMRHSPPVRECNFDLVIRVKKWSVFDVEQEINVSEKFTSIVDGIQKISQIILKILAISLLV